MTATTAPTRTSERATATAEAALLLQPGGGDGWTNSITGPGTMEEAGRTAAYGGYLYCRKRSERPGAEIQKRSERPGAEIQKRTDRPRYWPIWFPRYGQPERTRPVAQERIAREPEAPGNDPSCRLTAPTAARRPGNRQRAARHPAEAQDRDDSRWHNIPE